MGKKISSPIIMILLAFLAIFISIRSAMFGGSALFENVIGVDWRLYFQPAAEAVLVGLSPYRVAGFWNPP